ncbi:EAL domain-containing protein [Marinobacteraceae bacterium S3BR75-40.1]
MRQLIASCQRLFLAQWVPWGVFVLFALASLVLWSKARALDEARIQETLRSEARMVSREVATELQHTIASLQRMARRQQLLPNMTEAIWRADAREHLRHFPAYQSLQRVDRDFHIRWVVPVQGNESLPGTAIAGTGPEKRLLEQAAERGETLYSGFTDLPSGHPGLIIYVPVGQAAEFQGLVVARLRLQPFMTHLFPTALSDHLAINLFEDGRDGHTRFPPEGTLAALSATMPLPVSGLDWQIRVRPTRAWLEQQRAPWPWILFSAVLVTGLLFSLLVRLIQGILRHSQELEKARQDLRAEIDQRLHVEQSLEIMATIDELTGLANRRFFMEDLGHALHQRLRAGKKLALIQLDLDRFQVINDSLGHKIGDELLVRVAQRLNTLSGRGVTVAHASGDEFMLYQENLDDVDDVIALLHRIQRCFDDPFQIQDQAHHITASLGVALAPESGRDAETLLRNADAALFLVKQSGRNNYRFYTDGMHRQALERLDLDKDLRRALAEEQFVLFFQPQLDLHNNAIHSVEALIRWQHPRRGLVAPGQFIPVAEETGLISAIGRWVLKEACSQLARWQGTPYEHIRIAVNLSGEELGDATLVDYIESTLAYYGVAPERLELELTEEIFIDNIEQNLELLNRLHSNGIHLAIDDFGVGYSSLAYLRNFPVDLLKIDRSFISYVTQRHDDAVITRAVINLAHNMDVRVAAEGIENQEQLDFLRHHQCDLAQGFFIGKPMPAEDFERLLRQPQVTIDSPEMG